LKKTTLQAIAGGDSRTNAKILVEMLRGQRGPVRDIVLLNAGAGLFVAGRAESVREGIAASAAAVDSGRAPGRLGGAGAGHQRAATGMSVETSDLLGAIVAATRTRVPAGILASAGGGSGKERWEDAAHTRLPGSAGRAWPARDRRVQAPVAESRASCARSTIRWRSPAATPTPERPPSRC
jgi:hypothetical protein